MMPSDETTEILEARKRVQQLKDVHAVQGTDGNWNVDRYMRGMFNGMELALAIMEGRDVSYKEPPANGYTHEPDNPDFTAALKTLLNWHSWDSAVGMPDFLLSEMLVHILQGMEVAHDKQQDLQSVPETTTVTDGFGNPVAEYPTPIEEEPAMTPTANYRSTDLGPGNTV